MMKPLSPQASRTLAVLLLLLAVALVYAGVIRPVASLFAEREALVAEQSRLLDRYRGFAAQREALTARLEELRQRPASQGGYLSGENENLVAAQLQNRIKAIIQGTRAKLASSQVLQGADEQGFRRLGIRITMTAGIADLRDILFKLESGRPFLFLDNVDISAVQGIRAGGESGDLNVSFDVYGYMRTS
jgi:general secretion pathway protein M